LWRWRSPGTGAISDSSEHGSDLDGLVFPDHDFLDNTGYR
jgi:hypothetical protein